MSSFSGSKSFSVKKALSLFAFFAVLINAPLFAQESEHEQNANDEMLEHPVVAPTNNDAYARFNALPESVRRSRPFARMLHQYVKYAGESGVYDHAARLSSFEQSKNDLYEQAREVAMKGGASDNTVLANAWTSVGPRSTAITGGCTNALACDPKNGNIWYAGAAGGGVWKTTNAGVSWTALTDDVIPNLAVSAIAIDPINTNNIYVGSGDSYSSSDGFGGSGVYKSTDAGLTWARTGASNFNGTIAKVLVHPTQNNIVFVAAYDNGRGLWRTTNSGTNWTRVYPTSANAAAVIWDIVPGISIGGTLVMYLAEGNNIGSSSAEAGIYKSVDNGATWAKLTSAGLPTATNIGRVALACPKGNPSKVFALIAKPDGSFQGLYRSTNSATSFSAISSTPTTIFQPNSQFGAQGWYDLTMNVSPNATNQDTIFIGGVEAYYTRDGGTSWVQFSGYQQDVSSVHVDHHAIEFDPNNPKRLMLGTDGGIYYSSNSGTGWLYRDTGYVTTRFYHIGLDKADFKTTWGGAQDQGSWRLVNGGGISFKLGGDGFQALVSPTSPSIGFAENPYGDVWKNTSGTAVQLGTSYFDDGADWDAPFIIGSKSPYPLYLGRSKVWRSNDLGQSWSAISPVLGSGLFDQNIKAVALSPSSTSQIWVGLVNGKLKVTTDNGTNWTDKSYASATGEVTTIMCGPTDPNFVVVGYASTTGNRVVYSTNLGTNWKAANGSTGKTLPSVPVRAIALDSINPYSRWYAATDNGMYMTQDTGKTWTNISSGIGLAPCFDVRIHPNGATIRVATHGRGIWEGIVSALPVELTGLRAVPTKDGTKISWQTASETKNWGFAVMRSYNGDVFEQIGFVQGAGTSNVLRHYQFFDPKHDTGDYIFQLKQIDLDGTEHFSNHVEVHYGEQSVRLDQNYPNPFFVNASDMKPASTRIHYYLPQSDIVTISIYDSKGVLFRKLVANESEEAGPQDQFWDGRNDMGENASSGAYFYVLETASGVKLWNKLLIVE